MVFKLLNTIFANQYPHQMISRKSGKFFFAAYFICSTQFLMTSKVATWYFHLGKLTKEKKAKGEDTYGNRYENIDDMWKKELEPAKAEELKYEGRVGDKDSWYKKQVEYWDVRYHPLCS